MKRRSKIVSFRLSDEEYDSLKNVSATRGARSVSEFTRSVACTNGNGQEKLEDTLRTLTEKMEMIDRKLQMLAETLKVPVEDTEEANLKDKEPVE